jgi:hypothetical protein
VIQQSATFYVCDTGPCGAPEPPAHASATARQPRSRSASNPCRCGGRGGAPGSRRGGVAELGEHGSLSAGGSGAVAERERRSVTDKWAQMSIVAI